MSICLSKRNCFIFLVVGSVCTLLSLWPASSLAQEEGDGPLSDPVALGAWLYGGNCVRCHGPYESERVGSDLTVEELEKAVSGEARDGCQVKWSSKKGGPFSSREISAVVAYILAWNEAGGQLSLPKLPPYPTATPLPMATARRQRGLVEPTVTPALTLDPQIELIINGSNLARGAWLYTRNCYRCHLDYEFSRIGAGLPPDRVKRTISIGKAGTSMPAFGWTEGGKLMVREINSIVEYILAWEKLGESPALPEVLFVPPTPDPAALQMIPLPEIPPVVGDPDLGLDIYAIHCAGCHGSAGQGAIGPRLAKNWDSLRADLTVRSTIRQGAPGAGMPAWSQAAGGPLADDQIDHLVALILAWSAIAALPLSAGTVASPSSISGVFLGFVIAAGLGLGVARTIGKRFQRN